MKIKGHVTGIHTTGDQLSIVGQGVVDGSADWRAMETVEITLPDTPKNARAFYVGRKFHLTLEPK